MIKTNYNKVITNDSRKIYARLNQKELWKRVLLMQLNSLETRDRGLKQISTEIEKD